MRGLANDGFEKPLSIKQVHSKSGILLAITFTKMS